jgi:hypothetical protein
VAGEDEPVRGLMAGDLDALDRKICETIVRLVDKSLPEGSPYHRVAAWVGAADRLFPVEFFTPNYDLLIEQALEAVRVPYFDGFVGTQKPFFDPRAMEEDELPSRWARLWKIHGSINWSLDAHGHIVRAVAEASQSQVIYPSHLKYDESRRMPYLAMIDRLRAFLRRPAAVLITCGYSFRDEHLNEVLIQGAQGNNSAMVFGLVYSNLDQHEEGARLAGTRPNLTVAARDAAVVGTRRAPWLTAEGVPPTTDSTIVEWEDRNGSKQARFMLGDFQRLAELLATVAGAADEGEGAEIAG